MTAGAVATFWTVSVLLVLTPGAEWAYAISAGLRQRSVLPSIGGILAGHLLATAAVAAGVGALVARTPAVLHALTVVGALYLAWLGLGALRRPHEAAVDVGPAAPTWVGQALRGLGVSGLNPKVFLLFLALLPQFTDPGGPWPVAAQVATLGAVHVVTCAVVYVAIAHGARRVLASRPAGARAVSRVSGVVMLALAAVLLVEPLVRR